MAQGKHKPIFSPAVDVGDHVVVVNARLVELTGKKWQQKYYRWHTGFPGGLHEHKAKEFHKRWPTRVLEHAVRGMLGPMSSLRRARERRLHLYPDGSHEHAAQRPLPFALLDTKKPDTTAPWGVQPEYRITFTRLDEDAKPGDLSSWRITLEEPRIRNADRKRLRALRASGAFSRANSQAPHPDGFRRAGFPSHGKRY
jgi:large subunit ribosomal protein L13